MNSNKYVTLLNLINFNKLYVRLVINGTYLNNLIKDQVIIARSTAVFDFCYTHVCGTALHFISKPTCLHFRVQILACFTALVVVERLVAQTRLRSHLLTKRYLITLSQIPLEISQMAVFNDVPTQARRFRVMHTGILVTPHLVPTRRPIRGRFPVLIDACFFERLVTEQLSTNSASTAMIRRWTELELALLIQRVHLARHCHVAWYKVGCGVSETSILHLIQGLINNKLFKIADGTSGKLKIVCNQVVF